MNEEEALQWLYRQQFFGIKLGLENPRLLVSALGHPEKHLRFLHVAGTNGKGSVCAMAAAILQKAGIRTGLFTSPHLVRFHERITLDGSPIEGAEVAKGLSLLQQIVADLSLEATFFEIVVALALWWFHRQGAEVVVWETGMGGRLDATNIVRPKVCVLTRIDFDHQKWLGHTLAAIAAEKAGIIKPGCPTIFLPQETEAENVFIQVAEQVGAPWSRVEAPWHDGPLALAGSHQRWNAAAAVAACRYLLPDWPEEKYALLVREVLAQVQWPGRFQRITRGAVTFILDGAHNPAAMERLGQTWQEEFGNARPLVILGALADKQPAQLLHAIQPLAADFRFVPVRSTRALDPSELLALAGRGKVFSSLAEALQVTPLELQECGATGVLITGSLFLVGEALALFQAEPLPELASQ